MKLLMMKKYQCPTLFWSGVFTHWLEKRFLCFVHL